VGEKKRYLKEGLKKWKKKRGRKRYFCAKGEKRGKKNGASSSLTPKGDITKSGKKKERWSFQSRRKEKGKKPRKGCQISWLGCFKGKKKKRLGFE